MQVLLTQSDICHISYYHMNIIVRYWTGRNCTFLWHNHLFQCSSHAELKFLVCKFIFVHDIFVQLQFLYYFVIRSHGLYFKFRGNTLQVRYYLVFFDIVAIYGKMLLKSFSFMSNLQGFVPGTLCTVNNFSSLAVSSTLLFVDFWFIVSDEYYSIYLRSKFPFTTKWYIVMKFLIFKMAFQKVIRKQFFLLGDSRLLPEKFWKSGIVRG